jgi:hypothetical protein
MDNCGFMTTIEAVSSDGVNVRLEISSDCEDIQKFSGKLKEANILRLGSTIEDSVIYRAANGYLKHPACLVPAVIIRTIEVETGIALPGKTTISIDKK